MEVCYPGKDKVYVFGSALFAARKLGVRAEAIRKAADKGVRVHKGKLQGYLIRWAEEEPCKRTHYGWRELQGHLNRDFRNRLADPRA